MRNSQQGSGSGLGKGGLWSEPLRILLLPTNPAPGATPRGPRDTGGKIDRFRLEPDQEPGKGLKTPPGSGLLGG